MNSAPLSSQGGGDTPLHHAAANGLFGILSELCQKGASVNVKNKRRLTPLHLAKDAQTARVLLSLGADTGANAKSGPDGELGTPLSYAIQEGRVEVADVLGEVGALDAILDGQDD